MLHHNFSDSLVLSKSKHRHCTGRYFHAHSVCLRFLPWSAIATRTQSRELPLPRGSKSRLITHTVWLVPLSMKCVFFALLKYSRLCQRLWIHNPCLQEQRGTGCTHSCYSLNPGFKLSHFIYFNLYHPHTLHTWGITMHCSSCLSGLRLVEYSMP